MSAEQSLTRQQLDRLRITVGDASLQLGCTNCPAAGSTAIYEDGHVRLLCRACGFQTMRIKVAAEQ